MHELIVHNFFLADAIIASLAILDHQRPVVLYLHGVGRNILFGTTHFGRHTTHECIVVAQGTRHPLDTFTGPHIEATIVNPTTENGIGAFVGKDFALFHAFLHVGTGIVNGIKLVVDFGEQNG